MFLKKCCHIQILFRLGLWSITVATLNLIIGPHSNFFYCHTQAPSLILKFCWDLSQNFFSARDCNCNGRICTKPNILILETQLQCQNLKNGIEILSVFEFSEDKIALEASCSRGRSCWTSRRWRPRPNARGRATGSGKEFFESILCL